MKSRSQRRRVNRSRSRSRSQRRRVNKRSKSQRRRVNKRSKSQRRRVNNIRGGAPLLPGALGLKRPTHQSRKLSAEEEAEQLRNKQLIMRIEEDALRNERRRAQRQAAAEKERRRIQQMGAEKALMMNQTTLAQVDSERKKELADRQAKTAAAETAARQAETAAAETAASTAPASEADAAHESRVRGIHDLEDAAREHAKTADRIRQERTETFLSKKERNEAVLDSIGR